MAKKKTKTSAAYEAEIEQLQLRLEEAEETLRAIREGEVDAVVVSGTKGEQVFSLVGAESIYRLIVETMKEAALTLTFDGQILFCNAQFGQFVQRPLEQIVGHELQEFIAPNNHAVADALLIATRQQPVRQRLVFQAADGAAVPAHIAANVLNQPDGLSICVVASDLTDLENSTELIQQLRSQQNALRQSEARFRSVLENARDIIYRLNVQSGAYEYISPSAQWVTGFSAAELQALPAEHAHAMIHPDDLPAMRAAVTHLEETGQAEAEYRQRTKNGDYRWLSNNMSLIRDAAGRPLFRDGNIRDITARKTIEEALRFLAQSSAAPGEDFFQTLAVFLARILDMDYVCIDRLEEGSLSARTVAIYYDGKFEENVTYALKDTPCGDVVKDKICCFTEGVRYRFPNDQILQDMPAESYVGTILWDSDGQPIGLIAVLGRRPLDKPELATAILQLAAVRAAGELERRESEDALRYAIDELARSNRDLEAFAYLASHDLQSPLRVVTGMMNFLRDRYHGRLDPKADECIDLAVAAAAQMSELITDLLTYSRVGNRELELQNINLQEPVYRAVKLLRPVIDEAGAKLVIPDELPKVRAHPGELAQVFENLIANAVKFRSDRPPLIEVGARPDDGRCLVWVKDNGIGLDPQLAPKAFELFRRLHDKSQYPGTGIGLAICKKIVERHGGRIWVESAPGHGATFFFTLPVSQ